MCIRDRIYYGPSLALNYNVGGLEPGEDPRSPDIIVTPNVGVTYSNLSLIHISHFRKRSNAVAFAESFPREREWQLDETGEEPTTDYEVARRMKLKQQHLAWAECFE